MPPFCSFFLKNLPAVVHTLSQHCVDCYSLFFSFLIPKGLQISSDWHRLFYGADQNIRSKCSHCSNHSGGCFPGFCFLDRHWPIDEADKIYPLWTGQWKYLVLRWIRSSPWSGWSVLSFTMVDFLEEFLVPSLRLRRVWLSSPSSHFLFCLDPLIRYFSGSIKWRATIFWKS